jgi:hypothetical protein
MNKSQIGLYYSKHMCVYGSKVKKMKNNLNKHLEENAARYLTTPAHLSLKACT